jgi:hypothetical protein
MTLPGAFRAAFLAGSMPTGEGQAERSDKLKPPGFLACQPDGGPFGQAGRPGEIFLGNCPGCFPAP